MTAGEVSPVARHRLLRGHRCCQEIFDCAGRRNGRRRCPVVRRQPTGAVPRASAWCTEPRSCSCTAMARRLDEARRAVEHFAARSGAAGDGPLPAGELHRLRGDVAERRGGVPRRRAAHGREPQPGSPCCGWPGPPRRRAATIRRVLGDAIPRSRRRARPAVEIQLAAGDVAPPAPRPPSCRGSPPSFDAPLPARRRRPRQRRRAARRGDAQRGARLRCARAWPWQSSSTRRTRARVRVLDRARLPAPRRRDAARLELDAAR